MTKRSLAPLGMTALGVLLILAAYASAWTPGGAPVWGVWLMILGSAMAMAAATALGALNSGVRRSWAIAASHFLFAVILVGFGAPLLLAEESAASPLFLGLPIRAAIEIYGVGLLPILVLPIIYAIQFRSDGLDEESLAALRAKGEALRASIR